MPRAAAINALNFSSGTWTSLYDGNAVVVTPWKQRIAPAELRGRNLKIESMSRDRSRREVWPASSGGQRLPT